MNFEKNAFAKEDVDLLKRTPKDLKDAIRNLRDGESLWISFTNISEQVAEEGEADG